MEAVELCEGSMLGRVLRAAYHLLHLGLVTPGSQCSLSVKWGDGPISCTIQKLTEKEMASRGFHESQAWWQRPVILTPGETETAEF